LEKFFDRLGEERSAKITLVSADAAEWIANVVAARCPKAKLCLDPFHVIQWATAALVLLYSRANVLVRGVTLCDRRSSHTGVTGGFGTASRVARRGG
jgi:hypothetical protein